MRWREAQKSRTKSCQKIGCNCARSLLCCWMRRGHCRRKISWFDFVILSLSLLTTFSQHYVDVSHFLLLSTVSILKFYLCSALHCRHENLNINQSAMPKKERSSRDNCFFSAKTKFFRSVQEEFEVVQVCLNVIIVTFSSDSGILPARKLLAAINNLGAGEKWRSGIKVTVWKRRLTFTNSTWKRIEDFPFSLSRGATLCGDNDGDGFPRRPREGSFLIRRLFVIAGAY